MATSTLDVAPLQLEEQPAVDPRVVPLILQCQTESPELDGVADWVKEHRNQLESQLVEYGAILFRGFPLVTPEDFDSFIQGFDYENFQYEDSLSNAVRVVRTDRVFSANEAPSEISIFLHHEMAQTPIYPSKLFFFCEIAAEKGGATPLCRSDLLFEKLAEQVPQFAADCETKGLKYTNVMPGVDDPASGMGRSWQSTFGVANREEAEARMRKLNYSWEWLDDDCLKATTPVLPAVREIAPGRKSFFNQLIAAFRGWKDVRNDPSKSITFGDGQPLDRDSVQQAIDLADQFTFDLCWQPGDVALVDNTITMHARQPFQGKRKVWASLVAMETNV